MEKCPQCGSDDLMGKKFSDNGINLYEYYCPKCSYFEEEWAGMADSFAHQMIRVVDKFDKMVDARKKILPKTIHETLLLKLKATLVLQESTKKAPEYFKHIFWVITSLKHLLTMDSLQGNILLYLYAEEEWLNPTAQFFIEIDYKEMTELTPIEEDEKPFKHHYLALGTDSAVVLEREGMIKEINFKFK